MIQEIKKRYKKVSIFSRTHIVGYGGDIMKKIIFCFGIIVALLLSCILTKLAFVELFYVEPTIIQVHVSPNGKYTAYVYESNGGG